MIGLLIKLKAKLLMLYHNLYKVARLNYKLLVNDFPIIIIIQNRSSMKCFNNKNIRFVSLDVKNNQFFISTKTMWVVESNLLICRGLIHYYYFCVINVTFVTMVKSSSHSLLNLIDGYEYNAVSFIMALK